MAVVGYPYGSLPLQIAVTRNDYGQSMVLSPSTCQMLQHCTLYTGRLEQNCAAFLKRQIKPTSCGCGAR